MSSFNKVLLMGNLTRDPQLKQLPAGTQVAEFGLASNRKFKTQGGEDREETLFVDCTAFGKQAEVIHQYCRKGKPIFVEGRLKYDTWEDKQGGGPRSKLTVVVENFQFIGGKDGSGGFEGAAAESDRRSAKTSPEGDMFAGKPAAAPAGGGRRKAAPVGAGAKFKDADIPF